MTKRRVLVVDDHEDSAQLLQMMLEMVGFEVRIAEDGRSALEEARAFLPDAALLDIGLPDMDGYELARRVRALPGLARVRLVALTGFSEETDRGRASEAGFDHFVTKPFDPEALARLLA